MSSLNYWKRREEIAKQNYITEEAKYNRILAQLYNSMLVNIETQINNFYQKYAKAEKITMAEAMQKVAQMDVQAFQSKAKQYVQTKDFSKQANQELRLYNATMKINRLELLKANIGLEMIDAFNQMQGQFSTGLLKRAADEFERQAGILGMGVDDAPKLARTIVNASFHNADFSTRIWLYQGQLKNELSSLLSNGIVQGIHSRDLARQLDRKFKVSKSNAERLMRTEMARVQIAAQEESYKANGYDQYVFLAIGTACPDCLAINGQHFYVADMQAGENAPPMHPNCRCSTAAWMDRAETIKQIKAMSRVNGVASNTKNVIINKAKPIDSMFVISESGRQTYSKQEIVDEMNKSKIGQKVLGWIENSDVKIAIYEDEYAEGQRGDQRGNNIRIFPRNIPSLRVYAQTVIHEMGHYHYDIGQCQHAEAICFGLEKLHITGNEKLTLEEWNYVKKLAVDNYTNLEWEAGGYGDYSKIRLYD